ncbi:MAG: lipid-binding SYLF domain-containing protein [Syntrophobacteraceae bacterium]
MRRRGFSLVVLLTLAALVLVQPGVSVADEASKLNEASAVMREIMAIPETGIPPELFRNAQGIAVLPGLLKAGFFVGGRFGSGVLSVKQGGKWSNPVFISLAGGSFGLQIGAQSTDIILVFKTARGVEAIRRGKFTLGGDISVAAGPVGRHAEAGTDIQLKAEIYSYSRSRGLFGGIALEGAVLQVDHDADVAFYGSKGSNADAILANKVKAPTAAANFKQTLQKYSGGKK